MQAIKVADAPVLPQVVHAAAHEVVHEVVVGRRAAEHLADSCGLLRLVNRLETWAPPAQGASARRP